MSVEGTGSAQSVADKPTTLCAPHVPAMSPIGPVRARCCGFVHDQSNPTADHGRTWLRLLAVKGGWGGKQLRGAHARLPDTYAHAAPSASCYESTKDLHGITMPSRGDLPTTTPAHTATQHGHRTDFNGVFKTLINEVPDKERAAPRPNACKESQNATAAA